MKLAVIISFIALMALALFACSSCAAVKMSVGSSVKTQYAATYRIAVVCGNSVQMGSAFAVSKRHLITAKHVVTCREEGVEPTLIMANPPYNNDKMIEVTIDKFAKNGSDAVRLVVIGTSEPFTSVVPVKAHIMEQGEQLCHIGMDGYGAQQMKNCGYVSYSDDEDLKFSASVVPGNSGGPIYDSQGNVVGLVHGGCWQIDCEKFTVGIPAKQWEDLMVGLVDSTQSPDMNEPAGP